MDHATRERPLARLLASASAPLLTCLRAERPSNNVGLGAKWLSRDRSLCIIKARRSSAGNEHGTMMPSKHNVVAPRRGMG